MNNNRDFGGPLPLAPVLENPGPNKSREELIFGYIRFALKVERTHSEIVQGLRNRLYVHAGKPGWYWIKQYYERELLRLGIKYQAKNDEIGVKIDQINQRLAESS